MAGPTAPRDPSSGPVPHLAPKLLLARGALLWERLWPALLPAVLLCGAFLTLAFLDLLPLLGPWLHFLVLLLFAGGLAWLLYRGLRRLAAPDEEAARRRLERDSGLRHRPLGALEDKPAGQGEEDGDPLLAAYWKLHRRRLLADLRALRVSWPRAGWSRVDSLGLRALVALPLLIALVFSAGEWDRRLARAAVPGIILASDVPPARIDVWISPPAYTGEAPIYLDPDAEEPERVRMPAGSRILAQVSGGRGEPRLDLDGETAAEFAGGQEGPYRAEVEIEAGRRLSLIQNGLPIAGWNLQVVPDRPPSATYLSAPARAARGALQFEYEVSDDYGVDSLAAVIERRDAQGEGEVMELPLPLPERQPQEAAGRSFQDLTPHPWAGIPVAITLEARDGLGQKGRSESIEMVLPERIFNHPVARRLVELRRELTLHPDERRAVARALDTLARRPEHYFSDLTVSLGMLSAQQRLLRDRREAAITEVQALLWDLALHIEEGDLAVAERQLRELQQQLQDALANDAPQEEIERLMGELQNALDRFLESMMEQALQNPQDPQELEDMPADAQSLTRDDLQQMIEQARELTRSGAREQAQELLSQLQRMLENLQAQQMPPEEFNQRLQQSRQMMQDLQDMMRRQQELLDRSFQRAQRGDLPQGEGEEGEEGERQGSPGRAPGSAAGDAAGQEELRRELGELMRRSGEMTGGIPRPLGQAEQAMRAAREALERGRSGEALGPQGESLDHLQRGMEALLEDFAQQMGEGQGGEGNSFGQPGQQRDPFGRQRGEGGYLDEGEGVEIPNEAVLQRAREILNELRRRSGQRGRPQIELDYIDRLLRQF